MGGQRVPSFIALIFRELRVNTFPAYRPPLAIGRPDPQSKFKILQKKEFLHFATVVR
jgi:hypothetical protein